MRRRGGPPPARGAGPGGVNLPSDRRVFAPAVMWKLSEKSEARMQTASVDRPRRPDRQGMPIRPIRTLDTSCRGGLLAGGAVIARAARAGEVTGAAGRRSRRSAPAQHCRVAPLVGDDTPRRATLRLREHAEASESEKDSSAGHEAAKSRRGEAIGIDLHIRLHLSRRYRYRCGV